jgi:hypothetical protein
VRLDCEQLGQLVAMHPAALGFWKQGRILEAHAGEHEQQREMGTSLDRDVAPGFEQAQLDMLAVSTDSLAKVDPVQAQVVGELASLGDRGGQHQPPRPPARK